MTYFPDLTVYVYSPRSSSDDAMLNVGWLGAEGPVPTGPVDPVVRDTLVALARDPVHVMRGFHYCEFCAAESPVTAAPSGDPGHVAYLGSGEIHVPGDGVVYATPTLVVHYIDAHRYLPPAAFTDAVRRLAGGRAGRG